MVDFMFSNIRGIKSRPGIKLPDGGGWGGSFLIRVG
jgi:hypothetical protein